MALLGVSKTEMKLAVKHGLVVQKFSVRFGLELICILGKWGGLDKDWILVVESTE